MNTLTEQPSGWLVNGWRVAGAVVGERGQAACQDRAAVVPIEGGVVVVVADGAGGRGGGAVAAGAVIQEVAAAATSPGVWNAGHWAAVLGAADARIAAAGHGGESTAVVLALGERIVGASVGDSAAWLFAAAGIVDLTGGQQRRPMIGSGAAVVSNIVHPTEAGVIVVASDGFAKYAPRDRAAALVAGADPLSAVQGLIDLARLRSGALHDDVTVVVCRPPVRSR